MKEFSKNESIDLQIKDLNRIISGFEGKIRVMEKHIYNNKEKIKKLEAKKEKE